MLEVITCYVFSHSKPIGDNTLWSILANSAMSSCPQQVSRYKFSYCTISCLLFTTREYCTSCLNDGEMAHFSATRKRRCGECEGCRMDTCGTCINCRDMKKYRGTGRKKKACSKKNLYSIMDAYRNCRFSLASESSLSTTLPDSVLFCVAVAPDSVLVSAE